MSLKTASIFVCLLLLGNASYLTADSPSKETCVADNKSVMAVMEKCTNEPYCEPLKTLAKILPPTPCEYPIIRENVHRLAECFTKKDPDCVKATLEKMKRDASDFVAKFGTKA